ncbi:MAG: alpha/beta fold hydrolase [Candidatus Omnitrophica bacterium]|nr:alpha/beta fold hydrolase [Candidatus Omnitrophota bacterium]HOX55168.1 alpha/beta fold hydrolase [Candidatus Omnitrophota bacterium]
MKIKPLNYILKIIFIFLLGVFLFVFFFLVRNTTNPRRPVYSTPKDYGFDFRNVEFKTEDGLKLKGWLILNEQASPTIIICHGFGTNRSDVLVLADFIERAGYNIFLFDFRGHGESQGWYTSFGYLEQKDLEAACEFLKQNQAIKSKAFGVLGVSMGGSIAIMTAAKSDDIKAVVADSPYIDLDTSIIRHARMLLKIPGDFFGRLAIFSYRLRFFVDSSKISPLKEIPKISPRAVMIISGAKDKRMPSFDAEKLYLNAGYPKEFFLTLYAGHTESFWQNREEYERRVINFFRKYLPILDK